MQQIEVPGAGPQEPANTTAETPEAAPAPRPPHRSAAAMRLVRAARRPKGPAAAAPGTRAPLPTEPAPSELSEPPATFINGIRIPHGSVCYRVARFADGRAKKVLEYCTLTPPGTSEAIEYFPLSTPSGGPIPPEWTRVLQLWGTGFYAFQWLKPNNAWNGWSERKRLDDGRFPPMPAHRRLEGPPPAPPPQPAAAAPPNPVEPMAMIINALAETGGGQINASVAIALVMMMNQMGAAQTAALEARQRQWREEDDARAREREADHLRRLEREREFAAQDRARIESFYTTARARETAESENDRLRRLEERLEDALDMLDEQASPSEPAQKSITDQAIETFLPVVAARFAAAPPSAPPEGQKP